MGQHQTGRGPKGPYASSERHRADSPGSPPTHTHIQKKDVASCRVCDGQRIWLQKSRLSFQGYVA